MGVEELAKELREVIAAQIPAGFDAVAVYKQGDEWTEVDIRYWEPVARRAIERITKEPVK
jgi:hypothetical protein